MNKSLFLSILAVLAIAAGCADGSYESVSSKADTGSASYDYGDNGAAAESAPAEALTEMSTASMASTQRQVVRNGEIGLRVEDVEKAEKQITQMVAKGGGYVENTTSNDLRGSYPTIEMTVRVPATGFESSMDTLSDLGWVNFKNVDARDVTAEIVDLGARVKTLAAKEETFREMLRKSQRLEDVIALQDRLAQVRMEIERMEAQRKSLSDLAALSTIKVSLTQTVVAPASASPDPDWFSQSFATVTTSFMGTLRGLVSFLMWVVVYAPFWLVPVLFVWWIARRLSRSVPPVATTENR